jgi:solute carrier family 25 folate transporter 32
MDKSAFGTHNEFREGIRNGIAASLATVMEQILHPLEVIKTRLQSHDGQVKNNAVPNYKGITNASINILSNEGIRGLYRGVLITTFSMNVAKTIYFGVYGQQKEKYEHVYGKHSQWPTLIASSVAAFTSTTLTSPLWVTKTRVLLTTSSNDIGAKSVRRVVREIYQQYGIYGFYRGMTLSLLLCTQGVIQLTVYENLKNAMHYDENKGVIHATIPAYSGIVSKFVASLSLYPLTLVRTRIQQNQYIEHPNAKYVGASDVMKKTYQQEGIKGFYKGFLPGTLRALPANAIFFFFYEFFKTNLPI